MSSPRGGASRVRRSWALALLAPWLVAGCASNLARTEDGYRNTRHHYTIGVPGAPWERAEIDDAWIGFGRPGPQYMSMQLSCDRPVTDPAIMARNLLLGIREHTLRQAGPVAVVGRSGWSQTFDTRSNGVAMRVKTVTVVIDGCTYDWTLTAVGDFARAERAFDAWWGTFRPDPQGGGGRTQS